MVLACVVRIFFILFFCYELYPSKKVNTDDWRSIEQLAEEHPYIVAILDQAKEYVCTGTILDKRTVLTSGGCISPDPHYVAVGTAVLGSEINNNSIFQVAFSKLHGDYVFENHGNEPNILQMHSNIGLVFTASPMLDFFLESAIIGNYYASELKEKKLVMVGYGNVKTSDALVLQHQAYHQISCINPKWYYCVCGIEYADISYDEPFGEGAPALYGEEVVGVSARPTGSLVLKTNINYNIFTVLGPYLAWIGKCKSDSVLEFRARSRNGVVKMLNIETFLYILLISINIVIY